MESSRISLVVSAAICPASRVLICVVVRDVMIDIYSSSETSFALKEVSKVI
ncbi:hypothetical protein ACCUM_0408 [Candidatus Accumulibacter phosphatis]|uniref:Uncharacterized protein n=1 Tax=Candidatus Accumulibacter phosphatis TaxID=327160 RepID=A0A5S4EKE0_9PROT|nr:hypothetical protein ACCUM_0408 [Candidatus Accumulibacter phosphatis]